MRSRTKYRLLWEKHFGPIPVDEENRPYEIHHIDGNISNNDLSNLKCVSLQEHFNIHLKQGDYWACQAILIRLQIPEEERQKIIKLSALARKGIPRPDMIGDRNPMRNPEYVKKVSEATKGKPKSEEGRKSIGDAQRRRLLEKIECQYCGKKLDVLNHNRWHGSNCRRKVI